MKIMIFADSWLSINKYSEGFISKLMQAGNEIICILPDKESNHRKVNQDTGLKFYYIPTKKRANYLLKKINTFMHYTMAIKVYRPDRAILLLDQYTVTAGLAARFCHMKRIATITCTVSLIGKKKGIRARIKSFYYRLIYKDILKHSETLLFAYKYDYDQVEKLNWALSDRAVILGSWGVDLGYYRKVPLPRTDLVYMSMPVLCPYGVKCFIETAKLVREKYPKVKFLISGEFVEDTQILSEKEFDDACESGIIYYCDIVEDIRPYLEVCSIYMQPNIWDKEGHILEAEAAGRPILASDHPANRSMVIEGYNGFLLSYEEPKKWADKIILFLENKKLKENMADYSYQLICQFHDRNKIDKLISDKLS